jgi:RimJ/RimL family protein N-acetyltransferase
MGITKRNARFSDAALLLEWRNSQSAREFSQNSEQIRVEEHLAWLSKRLEKIKFEPFYVFELEHEPVGMSRLDNGFDSPEEFLISILVDPEQHSKGIGTTILSTTCEAFFDLHPRYRIIAKVHQNNFVSQKLFANAGFELQNSVGNFIFFKKTR